MMLGRVVVTAKSVAECPAALEYMRYAGCQVDLRHVPSPWREDAIIDLARDADALVFAMEPVTAGVIAAAHRLKVIARPGVGFDTVDIDAATARGIPVTVAAGCNDQSVADFTIGLILLSARRIGEAAASVQRGSWDRPVGMELWSKTLAIFGLGRIGKGVARRARGFDMRVLAVSDDQDAEFAASHDIEFVTREEALRRADVVSLHLPLTPDTRELVNADFLAAMKRGSFLINTARGPLVDERSLATAVGSGHLAGAAVDVLCQQGAGTSSPLVGVPGIIVTPHMATLSRESMERVAISTARSVVAVLRGQAPQHLANPDALRRITAVAS
jgi:phosphoglycerate dehydrogenase-like enzyme